MDVFVKDWCFDGELRKLMQRSIRERDKQRLIELYKDMYNCVIGEGDGSVSVNRSQQQKDDQELYGSQTMSLHSGNGPYRNKFGKVGLLYLPTNSTSSRNSIG